MVKTVWESNPGGGEILIFIFFDGKWDDKKFLDLLVDDISKIIHSLQTATQNACS
jgi:hypothetical protein